MLKLFLRVAFSRGSSLSSKHFTSFVIYPSIGCHSDHILHDACKWNRFMLRILLFQIFMKCMYCTESVDKCSPSGLLSQNGGNFLPTLCNLMWFLLKISLIVMHLIIAHRQVNGSHQMGQPFLVLNLFLPYFCNPNKDCSSCGTEVPNSLSRSSSLQWTISVIISELELWLA